MKKMLPVVLLPLFLSACLGVNADIVLNSNGSGTITLEYLVSKSLDSLGKLDGNERWNTVPVGKADFERTLDRLPDMKLISFSSKEDGENIRINVKMEFKNPAGLVSFLDASGRRAVFSDGAGARRLILTLNEGGGVINPELAKLVASVSEAYAVKISMTFPKEGNLEITDALGRPVKIPGAEIRPEGKTVSCSFPLYDVLLSTDGIIAGFHW